MDKELVSSLLRNNHYLRTGIFFIGSLFSLGALAPIGEYRYAFLFALLFIPLLIIEFIIYHLMVSEIRKKKMSKEIMQVGKLASIELRKNTVGIEFTGIVNGKVKILKYYTMDDNQERIMQNLARYKKIELEYYNRSGIIMNFHPISGE